MVPCMFDTRKSIIRAISSVPIVCCLLPSAPKCSRDTFIFHVFSSSSFTGVKLLIQPKTRNESTRLQGSRYFSRRYRRDYFFLIPALKGQINKVLIKAKLSHFVRPHQQAHPFTLGVTNSSIEQPLLRKVNFAICYVICQQNYRICSNK